jgi:hypothetical protein
MNTDKSARTPYRVVNIDHHNTLPGGVGMPHDRAVVLSTTETEPHPITGAAQPKQLYPEHGVCSLSEANGWVAARDQSKSKAFRYCFDSKCFDLAEHFLPSQATQAVKNELAQAIQDAVEDFCASGVSRG